MSTRPLDCQTIPQLIDAAAATYGEQPFLEQGEQRYSFTEFAQACRQLAAALLKEGIQPGDRIAIWAPNISEWIIAALGAQYVGAILVTMNTRYKGAEANYTLQQSRARLLFSIGNFLDCDYPAMLDRAQLPDLEKIVVFQQSDTEHTAWQDFMTQGASVSIETVADAANQVKPGATADILFTSGTTGNPKGVMCGHAQNLKTFASWSQIVGLEPGDRYLVISPFFHSFGYKAGILTSLMSGATLLPHDVFDSERILQRIEDDKITVLPGAPTLFQSLLAFPKLKDYDISSLKRATTGAAAIPVEMIEKMQSDLGFETVITAYGLTESCGLVTMCRDGDNAHTIATTSGRAIPDVEVRCVDHNNQPVAAGETGEIVVRGYNIMQGYFENISATRDAIDAEGWLHTGDVGVLDDNGNLRITDRLKDMFITGGFNCYPAEIENILASHPDIIMSAVIGIPDERMGEVAKAYIVTKPDASLDESTLIQWCRDNMANYKVPRAVAVVDALPLNASGKVLKTVLRDMH